jgi:transposase
MEPVAWKLFRKSNPWPLNDGADRLDRVGVEASSLGIWLYRELQPAGVPIVVAEAASYARFAFDDAQQD